MPQDGVPDHGCVGIAALHSADEDDVPTANVVGAVHQVQLGRDVACRHADSGVGSHAAAVTGGARARRIRRQPEVETVQGGLQVAIGIGKRARAGTGRRGVHRHFFERPPADISRVATHDAPVRVRPVLVQGRGDGDARPVGVDGTPGVAPQNTVPNLAGDPRAQIQATAPARREVADDRTVHQVNVRACVGLDASPRATRAIVVRNLAVVQRRRSATAIADYADVVNRPPPVIARIEQAEGQDHLPGASGTVDAQGHALIDGFRLVESTGRIGLPLEQLDRLRSVEGHRQGRALLPGRSPTGVKHHADRAGVHTGDVDLRRAQQARQHAADTGLIVPLVGVNHCYGAAPQGKAATPLTSGHLDPPVLVSETPSGPLGDPVVGEVAGPRNTAVVNRPTGRCGLGPYFRSFLRHFVDGRAQRQALEVLGQQCHGRPCFAE